MPRPTKHPDRYVPALDGLRTIAVTLVVLYHLGVPGFGGGLMGVAVFFTLSGYLITTNLVSTKLRHGTFRLGTFWFRRFRRLLPAVITTLVAVLFLTVAFDSGSLGTRAAQALSALFYVNNWHTIAAGNSYFDQFAGLGPLDHMWSLSIEEQFYIFWPLLLVVLFALLRGRRRIVTATLALTATSFALMWWLAAGGTDHTRIYEGTDTRAGGLLLGAALAISLVFRRHQGKTAVAGKASALVIGLVGMAGIFGLSIATTQNGIFLYQGGLALVTVCTVLVIVAALSIDGPFAKVLGAAPLRWIGERSYGIYLWHLPIIAFLPRTWLPGAAANAWVAWGTALLVCGISVLLAAISWRILEDPIRRHGIVEPIRTYWRARRHEVAPAPRQHMGAFPAACTVSMLALLLIGVPVLAGGGSYGANSGTKPGGSPAMELPKNAAAGQKATKKAPKSETMRCTTVIHVGDSTSIGLFDTGQLPEGADSGFQTYLNHGADEVVDSVFGARATAQGYEEYPSAITSVSELLAMGQDPDTCWVIATGVNDAANYAALPDYGYEQNPDEIKGNIKAMLDLLDGYKVMWNTVGTYQPGNPYYDDSNMQLFNKLLREAADDYDNVAIWDWAAEVAEYPDWFIPGDGTHFIPEGNAQRAERFAAALSNAFPENGTGNSPAAKVVSS